MNRINWLNTLFLIISPLLVLIFLPLHIINEGLDWRLIALFVFYALATGLSITGGYHRLFSHRSYEAKPLVKLFYLIFGSAALEGSAIKWCSDHRRHHKKVDTEEDPYNINKGFFYAHMGWVFLKDDPQYRELQVADLKADPLVAWQDRNNFAIAIYVGFLLPTLIGLSFGSPWGGLLYGTLLRVVVTHHTTFFINSLCHMWGSQPYGDKTSARDNFVMAFLTHGEGYHNFHHRFEADYRNGIRWYQWDPTKWLIRTMSFFGLTFNLRKVSDAEILKARILAVEKRLIRIGFYDDHMRELRVKIEETHKRVMLFKKHYEDMKKDISQQRDEKIRQIKAEMALAKVELASALRQWQHVTETRSKLPQIS
jgi:stearoyl-CoA desaturase (delta-9 desaturase)